MEEKAKVLEEGGVRDWMWLLKTDKGDFFCTVIGKWTQEEAVKRVKGIFEIQLKVPILGLIPRKRSTGPDEVQCTIYERQEKVEGELDFHFLAGRKIWEAVGRAAEFDFEHARQLEER